MANIMNMFPGGGGGGGGFTPPPADGKTRLYLSFPGVASRPMRVIFSQSVSRGVSIDWGDGSSAETVSGTGEKYVSHTYATGGDYILALTRVGTCNIGLGVTYSGIVDTRYYISNALKRVIAGAGITAVTNYAFRSYFYSLESVTGLTVWTAGEDHFRDCFSLRECEIPSGATAIGSRAFYQCYSLTDISIPSGVTTIGQSAFAYTALSELTIPSSVTSINNSAFGYMPYLNTIRLLRTTPPLLGTQCFFSLPATCVIYVPSDSLSAYQTATNWSALAAKMVGE